MSQRASDANTSASDALAPAAPEVPGTSPASRAASPAHERELLLVRAVLRGSPEAIEQFSSYLARVPPIVEVHRSSTTVAVREQDVPDLIQDCLSVIWRKLPEFEGRASLSTWIFRLCAFELCNGFRRIARRRDRDSQVSAAAIRTLEEHEDPGRQIVNLDLRAGIERLSMLEQTIVRLRHYEGRTLDEIASEISITSFQVKSHYHRALQRLHDFLRAEGEPP